MRFAFLCFSLTGFPLFLPWMKEYKGMEQLFLFLFFCNSLFSVPTAALWTFAGPADRIRARTLPAPGLFLTAPSRKAPDFFHIMGFIRKVHFSPSADADRSILFPDYRFDFQEVPTVTLRWTAWAVFRRTIVRICPPYPADQIWTFAFKTPFLSRHPFVPGIRHRPDPAVFRLYFLLPNSVNQHL